MQERAGTSGKFCPACGQPRAEDERFCKRCDQLLVGANGVRAAGIGQRVLAYILDIVLVYLTLFIGYLIWWLIVLGRGQTPGKQLLGIYVIKDNGEPSGWGYTFLREFVVKGLLFGFLALLTLSIAGFLNLLWPFWDRDRQALHDKIVGTLVVQGPRS